jgi:B12-binding domain/radical SAM domain protein
LKDVITMFQLPSPKTDLCLIHPPSVFDFRQREILFGPISDVIPSTPAFEMYPIGFSSIAEVLSNNGIGVRIVNLAYLMLKRPRLDVRRYLKTLRARAFGISLHWLPHAHGAVELARLLKEVHPDVPVILGGYSSTYFADEIIRYPFIDYVVRGDSTERALVPLMRALDGVGRLEDVPNLVFKRGDTVVSSDSFILDDHLNDFSNNYVNLFRKAVKYRDPIGMTPIHDWWSYPITMIVTCRGCTKSCVICGGSKWAAKRYLGRDRIAYRDANTVADDVIGLARFTHAPIFIVGDIRQGGDDYARRFLERLAPARIKNPVVLELFDTAPEGFFQTVSRVLPNVNYEISPETHDDGLRRVSGKPYSARGVEDNIRWALKYGARKFDVFFMTGIPRQDYGSVIETVRYGGRLMKEFGVRLMPFISPLAPFLDPGSIAFENPAKYGYTILHRTFHEHVAALSGSSWQEMLNYESASLCREDLVAATYEAGARLNEVKRAAGNIDSVTYERVKARTNILLSNSKMSDAAKGSGGSRKGTNGVKVGIDTRDLGIVCDKEEIRWQKKGRGFRFLAIGCAVAREVARRTIPKKRAPTPGDDL